MNVRSHPMTIPWTLEWFGLNLTAFGPVGLTFTFINLACLLVIPQAWGHAAPSGWAYPYQCCSDRDCHPVHGHVTEGPSGYVIEDTGEIVGYGDPRLKNSPDGEFHLCAPNGSAKPRAICLFVPPRSF
ncbi:hypothetical protein [Borborobacter arsenicus]|uniref:hypothetical protein n=1 Tax=Borborobacter arsenicus TaxID=1851146 RepID=UPI001FDED243|nr:hypothetical protein [Pseudaminobacter arsenicus]